MDPRDTAFEVDEPVRRVYLWDRPPPPAGVTQELMGWWFYERRLLGAPDVRGVLARAEEYSGPAGPNSTYTVYVETEDDGHPGLTLLAGTDPTIDKGGAHDEDGPRGSD